jgi:hypothetical protein
MLAASAGALALALALHDMIAFRGGGGGGRWLRGSPTVQGLRYAANSVADLLHHSLLTFQTENDFEWTTPPLKFLHLGVAFFALILTATYTANLAAFLSQPNFKLHGPRTIQDLRKPETTVCTILGQDMDVAKMKPWVGSLINPANESGGQFCRCDNDSYVQLTACQWHDMSCEVQVSATFQYCYDQLQSGKVDGIVGPKELLNEFLRSRCDSLASSGLSFGGQLFGFQLNPTKYERSYSHLGDAVTRRVLGHMTAAVAQVTSSPAALDLKERIFGQPACTNKQDNDTSEIPTISVRQLGGLFFLLAGFIVASLLFSLGSTMCLRAPNVGHIKDTGTSEATVQGISSDVNASHIRHKDVEILQAVITNQESQMQQIAMLLALQREGKSESEMARVAI